MPPVPGVIGERVDWTEVSERGHDGIHPVYRERFSDHGMSGDFADLS